MNKIRIAFIVELYGTKRQGGEQEAMVALADHLRAYEDLDIQVYSYSGLNSKPLAIPQPSRLALLPYIRDIAVVPRVGSKLARTLTANVDIFHISSPTMFSFVKSSAAVVTSIHSIPSERAEEFSHLPDYWYLPLGAVSKVLKALEQRSLSHADSVIVLKEKTKTYLQEELKVNSERIIRIPNAVDTNLFSPVESLGDAVLFVGRPNLTKGIDTILAAAPSIHAPVIIVAPRISEELRSRAVSLGIEVHERLPHDALPEFYARARVFCLPSLKEDQPLTVLEAMASGIPSVVSLSAAADLIEHDRNGVVIPPRDPHALASAVNELLDDAERCRRYGQAGREKVMQEHSWDVVARAHYELYMRLYDRNRSR